MGVTRSLWALRAYAAAIAALLTFGPMVVLAGEGDTYDATLRKVADYLLTPGTFFARYLFPPALHRSDSYFACVCAVCFLIYFVVIYVIFRSLIEDRAEARG